MAGGNHVPSTSHLRQWELFSQRVFHSKEVRVLASNPLVVKEGCGQVPGAARRLEAPWLRDESVKGFFSSGQTWEASLEGRAQLPSVREARTEPRG